MPRFLPAMAVALAACTGGGSNPPTPCGAEGMACCAADACDGGLVCQDHTCAQDPCTIDAPGAAWLAFASNRTGNYDLFLVRADGSCLGPVTDDPAADLAPVWTPGGTIGFASTRSSGIGVYQHVLATGADEGVPILGSAMPTSPSWSPDGDWLAFEGKIPGANRSDVYLVLANGGSPVPLTSAPGSSAGPVYSPDGATIYFVSNRTGSFLIHRMVAASGEGEAEIPGTTGVLGRPAVSPDGSALAYARAGTGGKGEVIVHRLSDDQETIVTSLGDADPAFDATGARLAVSSTRGGDTAIWIVDAADGGNAVRVTTPGGTAVDGQPALRR